MKLAVLSNVNLDILIQQIQKKHEVFAPDGYGQWVKYALGADSRLEEFAPECIYIILDGFGIVENIDGVEAVSRELEQYIQYISRLIKRYPAAAVVVSDIHVKGRYIDGGDFAENDCRIESCWDSLCDGLLDGNPTAHRLRLRELIYSVGTKAAYDAKLWYMGSVPYSIKMLTALADKINSMTDSFTSKRRKVLVTDLDNTLWGGVVGEDGPMGIELSNSHVGAIYRDVQKLLVQFKDKGILLGIVSKNNSEDVRAAFEQNPYMYLKLEDFAAVYANWDSKVQNIRAMARELNLGLDSFVFLDDNNIEREAVKMELPEVAVIDFPRDAAKLPEVVLKAYEDYFRSWRITGEDMARTRQYREESARRQAMQKVLADNFSMDDYIRSLDIKIKMAALNEGNLERVVQLLNKTNQFNTNTLRMSLSEMKLYAAKESNRVYTASVSDRYGDSGLVSVLLARIEGNICEIENFIMSCRVMGRQIENAVVRAVENLMASEGVTGMRASYIPSAKNSPVKDLWERLGYRPVHSGGNGDENCGANADNTGNREINKDGAGAVNYFKSLTDAQEPTLLTADTDGLV